MKVKMLEHYKDSRQTLIQGDEVAVSDSLGKWLLENNKAVQVIEPVKEIEKEPIKEPVIVEPYKKRGKQ